ncbi:MAG: RidA family protein [Asticcacaulis sp.]|uniref:RidA family protein n=1 Tax=Asticcacaulis sp. TaxID=1872648 RepID=UPI003F7CAB31
MSIKRIGGPKSGSGGQILPFSRATVANGFVFVSGQVGMDETGEIVQGGIVAQTRRTMDNIVAILAEAGCTLNDVVKANVWLDDTRDFAAFNRIYASYFNEDLPARSCVRSQIMIDAKVEIDVIAYKADA